MAKTSEPVTSAAPSGKRLRKSVPRDAHADWSPPPNRADPVTVVTDQNASRLQWLVPVRHERMSQSAFAFYRGAAKLMAGDLVTTPITGIQAQICGDAHLSNFGTYGSRERALVFDVNDFDETLPGPWEWDVKRLAASCAIAARHNEFDAAHERDLAQTAAAAYRRAMRTFADMNYLDLWYDQLGVEEVFDAFRDQMTKKRKAKGKAFVAKARSKDSLHARSKLAELVDGEYRIRSDPPLLIPIRSLPLEHDPEMLRAIALEVLEEYRATVDDSLRTLLDRYRVADLALKVVGVGSVGTRCGIVLLEGHHHRDPLFLQFKEAGASVLEAHLAPSKYVNEGQRVVVGQRIMQTTSDMFLGWTTGAISDHHYYVRQLKDMKGSVDVEGMTPKAAARYAQICGRTLAHAHARSTEVVTIAAYLGRGEAFDHAIAEFAVTYADQNDADFDRFRAAIASGRIEADE